MEGPIGIRQNDSFYISGKMTIQSKEQWTIHSIPLHCVTMHHTSPSIPSQSRYLPTVTGPRTEQTYLCSQCCNVVFVINLEYQQL